MLFIISLAAVICFIIFAIDNDRTIVKRILYSGSFAIITIIAFCAGLHFYNTDYSTHKFEKEYQLVAVGNNSHVNGKGTFVYSSFMEKEVYNVYVIEGEGYRLHTIPANATLIYETGTNATEAKLMVYNCNQPWFVDLLTFWFFDYPTPEYSYELYIPEGSLSREIYLEP